MQFFITIFANTLTLLLVQTPAFAQGQNFIIWDDLLEAKNVVPIDRVEFVGLEANPYKSSARGPVEIKLHIFSNGPVCGDRFLADKTNAKLKFYSVDRFRQFLPGGCFREQFTFEYFWTPLDLPYQERVERARSGKSEQVELKVGPTYEDIKDNDGMVIDRKENYFQVLVTVTIENDQKNYAYKYSNVQVLSP